MNTINLIHVPASVAFLAMAQNIKGFRCWDSLSKRLRISRHVTFWEHTMFSRLFSFHASFSNSHHFFTNTSVDLFPLSEPTLDTELIQSVPTYANRPNRLSPMMFLNLL